MKLDKLLYTIILLISASSHSDTGSVFVNYCNQIKYSSFDFNLPEDSNKEADIKKILIKIETFKFDDQSGNFNVWSALFFHYFLPYDVFKSFGIKVVDQTMYVDIKAYLKFSQIIKTSCELFSIEFDTVLRAFVEKNTILNVSIYTSAYNNRPSFLKNEDTKRDFTGDFIINLYIGFYENNSFEKSFDNIKTVIDYYLKNYDFNKDMLINLKKCMNFLSLLLKNIETYAPRLILLLQTKLVGFFRFYSAFEKIFYESNPNQKIKFEKKYSILFCYALHMLAFRFD